MKNNNVKKSHKVLTVILIIFCILIVGIAAIYIWQKDNIDAVVYSVKYSKEDIEKQIDDSKDSITETLREYNIENLRDFTFEEEEQIRKGEITYEQAIAKIIKESGVADKLTVASGGNLSNQNNASDGKGVPNVKADGNNPQDVVAEYAVKLYGLKAYYLGQLGNMVDSAKAEYKTNKDLGAIAGKYIGKAADLEREADGAVEKILSELESKLEALDANTSVINSMRKAYKSEKTLKKSYYLSLYQNKK